MKNNNAPIILFVYSRKEHAEKTITALRDNEDSELHNLIIYSDGPKYPHNEENVREVREYIRSIVGFKEVIVKERPYNYGLAKSIIEGVTEVLKTHDAAIILEDDIVTSKYFLQYMNQALLKYKDNERVASIHGYVYPVKDNLPETFFQRGADCWGWATWSRAWKYFNPDGRELLGKLETSKLQREFDYEGTQDFFAMLRAQVQGENDSWAIRWHASAFLYDKLTLYPGRSLVENIGNDGSGTHPSISDNFNVRVTETPILVTDICVEHSEIGYKAFKNYFGANNSFSRKIVIKIFGYEIFKVISLYKRLLGAKFRRIKRVIKNRRKYFEGPYDSWDEASSISDGYHKNEILNRVFDAAIKVKNGVAKYERDSVIFGEVHYSWPLLSILMLTLAKNQNKLTVLDFGGALGTTYYQNIQFLNTVRDLNWLIIEQVDFVEVGNKYFATDALKFYPSFDAVEKTNPIDVVLLSSVLQYIASPSDIIAKVKKTRARYVVIDRTIVNASRTNYIYKQNISSDVYDASYPCWSLSESELINQFNPTYTLMTDFDTLEFKQLKRIKSKFSGYIFEIKEQS